MHTHPVDDRTTHSRCAFFAWRSGSYPAGSGPEGLELAVHERAFVVVAVAPDPEVSHLACGPVSASQACLSASVAAKICSFASLSCMLSYRIACLTGESSVSIVAACRGLPPSATSTMSST